MIASDDVVGPCRESSPATRQRAHDRCAVCDGVLGAELYADFCERVVRRVRETARPFCTVAREEGDTLVADCLPRVSER